MPCRAQLGVLQKDTFKMGILVRRPRMQVDNIGNLEARSDLCKHREARPFLSRLPATAAVPKCSSFVHCACYALIALYN
jgi:hypothetical protein